MKSVIDVAQKVVYFTETREQPLASVQDLSGEHILLSIYP
jgi:hypothetical protein